MVKYGLIGKHISHSFSSTYFNEKFKREGIEATYTLYDIDHISKLQAVLDRNPELKGLNVTSPYKREVINFLDELTPEAQTLNAVNVIEFRSETGGKRRLIGHNTDSLGFEKTLEGLAMSDTPKALILGTGGAASAVALALKNQGISYLFVSRKPSGDAISYQDVSALLPAHNLIINATPVGLFPKFEKYPLIDYARLSPNHICYDLIYNPPETKFLSLAKAKGATTKNGLDMLINQAELSWQIWNSKE